MLNIFLIRELNIYTRSEKDSGGERKDETYINKMNNVIN